MKNHPLDSKIAAGLAIAVLTILAVMPFHAFLTVWLSSVFGHYTLLRLWKEIVLVPAGAATLYLLWRQLALRQELKRSWLWRLILIYCLMTLVWGIVAVGHHAVSRKAVLYGELLNLRPFAILLVAWVAASTNRWLRLQWQKILLVPAVAVIVVGLLQRFILPTDVLRHFGYGAHTIPVSETIDHNKAFPRIRSTLRGANLLGGYLIMVVSAGVVVMKSQRYRLAWLVGLAAAIVVLFESGSRGAWLGLLGALVVLLFLRLPDNRARMRLLLVGIAGLLALTGLVVGFRHSTFVESTVFHSSSQSVSPQSSNAAHYSASVAAAKQVVGEPLGRGPGTAGPASVYNSHHPSRIAENYFLQIGQETGWLGLGLFVAISVLIAWQLWRRRHEPLSEVLLASFVGLSLMGLLMHVWTDDTIAYLWWGLAGIALAVPINRGVKSREN
jgi:hypothetical protein